MSDLYVVRDFQDLALAIMARPRAGDWLQDEVSSWCREGVLTVVSLLESAEVTELGLEDEPHLCASVGIEFVAFPIPDRGVPASFGSMNQLVAPLVPKIKAGHMVTVHCRAGIGRSSLVAASILVRAGVPYPKVFPALSKARGLPVPDTDAQKSWVQAYAQTDL